VVKVARIGTPTVQEELNAKRIQPPVN